MVITLCFLLSQILQRMRLNEEERNEIILWVVSGYSRMVANAFNKKPGTSITHDTVEKRIGKLKNRNCHRSCEMRS